jgi:hypothetical protein
MDLPTLINLLSSFEIGGKKRSSSLDPAIDAIRGSATSNNNSIKYRAKNLVAQYPILYSDNVSSSTVQLLNKALEHEYVNLIRLLVQNVGAEDNFSSTSQFLGNFHQNIYSDRNLEPGLNESVINIALKEANKELLTPIEEDLNFRTLNEGTITKEHRMMLEDKGNGNSSNGSVPSGDDKVTSAKANIDKVEISKANELTPTSVSADIAYVKDNNSFNKTITFGVKAVAHLLSSGDIEKYLPSSVITRTPIMRAIQWTTGEIKFFRDFLLNVDEIKDLANKNNSRDTFWWRKLQELSRVSKMHPFLKNFALKLNGSNADRIKAPIPITTMVITKENVDNIKFKHGIDILNKPSFAYKIMRNFFLMTFIVVDESIETVYMYNEETKNFSTYSFKSLEGHSKQKNLDIKDLYSLFK